MEVSRQIDVAFFLVTGIIVLLLLAGGCILFFRVYTRKILRQQERLLRAETKHKEELLFSTISSVEAERKRIATDIHDELGNIFSTLSVCISRFDTGNNPSNVTAVNDGRMLVEKGLSGVRRIAHTMMPHELEMFGLVYTVETLCDRLQSGNLISVSFTHAIDHYSQNPSADLAIYRVLQELTSNTIKHAGARNIFIDITAVDSVLQVLYKDDGKGIDTASIASGKGLGLKNIESRVSMVSGKVSWSSAPQKGITCLIEIPFSQKPAA